MSTSSSVTLSNAQIRHQVRTRRQSLTPSAQSLATKDLLLKFKSLPNIDQITHIALYLAQDGELSPNLVIDWLWKQGKSVYLPVIHPFSKGQLLFLHYAPETKLIANKYNILEPALRCSNICPLDRLDMICTPLVAFDAQGHRIGMGGGYYDRTFAHFKGKKLGLAHDCQQVTQISPSPWDQDLDFILTPSQVIIPAKL